MPAALPMWEAMWSAVREWRGECRQREVEECRVGVFGVGFQARKGGIGGIGGVFFAGRD